MARFISVPTRCRFTLVPVSKATLSAYRHEEDNTTQSGWSRRNAAVPVIGAIVQNQELFNPEHAVVIQKGTYKTRLIAYDGVERVGQPSPPNRAG
jgi:hypothetical protein